MAGDKNGEVLRPMSAVAEINAMVPEAELVELSENEMLKGKNAEEFLSADADTLPVREYVKRVDGDTHVLEVYADGSYLTYGMVDDYATVTASSDYTQYINMIAYYNNMYPGISMQMLFDYEVDNNTQYIHITGARNSITTNNSPSCTGRFNDAVFVSSPHAYRTADVTEDETGDIMGTYRLGIRAQRKNLYVYKEQI